MFHYAMVPAIKKPTSVTKHAATAIDGMFTNLLQTLK